MVGNDNIWGNNHSEINNTNVGCIPLSRFYLFDTSFHAVLTERKGGMTLTVILLI